MALPNPPTTLVKTFEHVLGSLDLALRSAFTIPVGAVSSGSSPLKCVILSILSMPPQTRSVPP